MGQLFSESERATLKALAEAALPPGRVLPGASDGTLRRTEALMGELPAGVLRGYRGLLAMLELRALTSFGARFANLPLGHRLRALEAWEKLEPTRLALRGLLMPLKLAYFDDPGVHAALQCRYALDPPPRPERARWRAQVLEGKDLQAETELECDVVVVGTGAGGAPVARALAERGHAVVMIEEGELYGREHFTGRAQEMVKKLYRRAGATVAFGNTAIPIPIGKAVGGTTLINSGTCFRLPESTLAQWRDEFGLREFTADLLAPFYEEVERELGVGPSSAAALGKPAELIARGCDALGYSHHPLDRNAPGCDGQGLCCFGCPSDAKRSTNISFLPKALERGAQLVTGVRVDKVLLEGEHAVGVEGTANGARVRVRARAVVLACGTLGTPALLLQNKLANASGQVGCNLSIHPATSALALFDEPVNSWRTVPQGYAIDAFADEGIMFEGASVPLDITGASLTGFGPAYVALMERFDRSLNFGFMVKDSSRGRVRLGPGGEPLMTYWLNGHDLGLIQRAFGILCRVYFAAGAREVLAQVVGHERIRNLGDVEKLEQARLSARQVDLTAYHPLGTARMGKAPLRSVVDLTHETHDVHNLFICDGSAVPGSLGVNPQVTIMAMALRAGGFIDRRLQRLSALAA